ncbi:hypothetical protein HYW55_05510 [Candidatus Gottesmanbacteria bacterium]|nr:hypothetical protein [Candidatus Gottesmanbacteria bacterium]
MKILKRLFLIGAILGIGALGVVYTGVLKNQPILEKNITINPNILGENISLEPTMSSQINQFVGETFQSTKETVGQKVEEVEKTIVKSVEKEVTNLTQSQITVLQTKICQDWGIITPVPTSNP